MIRNVKKVLALAALAFTFGLRRSVYAQDSGRRRLWKPAPSTARCTALRAAPRSTRSKTGN